MTRIILNHTTCVTGTWCASWLSMDLHSRHRIIGWGNRQSEGSRSWVSAPVALSFSARGNPWQPVAQGKGCTWQTQRVAWKRWGNVKTVWGSQNTLPLDAIGCHWQLWYMMKFCSDTWLGSRLLWIKKLWGSLSRMVRQGLKLLNQVYFRVETPAQSCTSVASVASLWAGERGKWCNGSGWRGTRSATKCYQGTSPKPCPDALETQSQW